MKRALLFCSLSLILSTSAAHGQKLNDSLYNYWAVRLPLLNLVDQLSPNIQLAIERRFDKHNAVQLQGGISFDMDTSHKCCTELNGFRLKAEYRRYFHIKKHFSFFVAGEVFYTQYNTTVSALFHDTANTREYIDVFTLHKAMYGFCPKWGIHLHGKHFLFNVYMGIGIKNRIVTQTGRDNLNDERDFPHHPNVWYASQQTGNNLTVHFPLNIAVGYFFR